MHDEAFAGFTRQTSALFSRRGLTLGIGAGAMAAVLAGFDDILAGDKSKKKKRRRKRRRRKNNNNSKKSSPPTCAEQCSESFDVCFERATDSTLCGDTLGTLCRGCFSDQECVDTEHPYCVNIDGVIDRATNESTPFLVGFCGPFLDSVCVAIVN